MTILEKHGVIQTGEYEYQIEGKPYTIRFVGRTDDGFGKLWECDCPAGQHGKMCKHLRAVIAANNEICDANGWD